MTNRTNIDDAPQELTDAQLEDLLTDAFEAPPIPRSLLKRLDRVVEQEWGESPGLANSQATRVRKSLNRSARWLRGLPVAGALGLVMVLAVVFYGQGPAYAWAQFVEALTGKDVVQVESENVSRWLALSEGVISEKSSESARLLNLKQHVLLERSYGADEITKRSADAGSGHVSNRNQLLLTFLAGRDLAKVSEDQFAGARVVSEHAEFIQKR